MFRRRPIFDDSDKSNRTSVAEDVFIRKAGPLEVFPHLFHDLGIQSNILVSAKYAHPSTTLTPPLVHYALAQLISQHAALSTIGINRQSTKKPGNTRLWEAHLPLIYTQDCVEFVDVDFDGDGQLAQIIEDVHNTWFDTSDATKPWWKVVVVNQETVVFVFHHAIADGLSGYAFHRGFLEALNASTGLLTTEIESFETMMPNPESLPAPIDDFKEKLSWLFVIKNFLFWVFVRFLVPKQYFLFSDAVVLPNYPTITKPFPKSERTVTNVAILRIQRDLMKKCLLVCRQHDTSFTALLHTLVQLTLATDEYPNAKIGFSRLAVSVRDLVPRKIGKDEMVNAVSCFYKGDWLSRYRITAPVPPMILAGSRERNRGMSKDDVNKIWDLANRYRNSLHEAIHTKKSITQQFLTCKLLGEDNEDVGDFFGLGLYQNNSFLVSNLGVFQPKEGMRNGGWRAKDVAFSAGAVRANLGDYGMSFNVASMEGGDCVVCSCWEKGVLEEELVRRVLGAVGKRMRSLVS